MLKKAIGTLTFIAASAASLQVSADSLSNLPNFYGNMAVGALNVQNRDVAPWGFDVEAGITDLFIISENFKIKYDLSADFSNAINDSDDLTWSHGNLDGSDSDDVYIRNAKIIAITKYGSFVFAPRTASGQWAQMYGEVDTFYYNRFHSQTDNISIFGQSEQTKDLLAYSTPRINGLQFGTSMVATNENNDKDLDVWTNRLTYKSGNVYLAASHTIVDAKGLPTLDDYKRTAVTASYDFGSLKIAGVHEINRDHPTGDWDSYVVNFNVKASKKFTIKAAYAEKDHDKEVFDLSGFVVGIDHHFSDNVDLFVETGQYEETNDNISIGFNVSI